ncbi:hypothetical protein [Salinibacterium sp. ZJ454]|uniref:hypothetical protein n=1 Tax=Salinibacterium sp. ZJ454 TaxID=2708339 RepID=UPI0014200825|nr:hypothetical protein [Salinibacterium sp. ZJ454]
MNAPQRETLDSGARASNHPEPDSERRDNTRPAGLPAPVSHVTSTIQQPGYRARDFSPEAARSTTALSTATSVDASPLTYHTQAAAPVLTAVPGLRKVDAPAAEAPAATMSEAPAADPSEAGLTRRELRARRQAEEAASRPAPALIEPEQPAPHTLGAVPISRIPETVVPEAPARPTPPAPASPALAPAVAAPIAPAVPPVVIAAQAVAPTVIPASAPASALTRPAPAAPVPAPAAPVSRVPVSAEATRVLPTTPSPSAAELFEQIIHDGGGSHHTANALVMPTVPTHADLPRSLDGTGEILITGSMDLSRGYSAISGHRPILDDIEIDRLIDAEDHEIGTTDSVPVRASHAISTHTATRGMIQAKRPSGGNKMLAVLAITASAMAVVVVGLVILGVVSGIF